MLNRLFSVGVEFIVVCTNSLKTFEFIVTSLIPALQNANLQIKTDSWLYHADWVVSSNSLPKSSGPLVILFLSPQWSITLWLVGRGTKFSITPDLFTTILPLMVLSLCKYRWVLYQKELYMKENYGNRNCPSTFRLAQEKIEKYNQTHGSELAKLRQLLYHLEY